MPGLLRVGYLFYIRRGRSYSHCLTDVINRRTAWTCTVSSRNDLLYILRNFI